MLLPPKYLDQASFEELSNPQHPGAVWSEEFDQGFGGFDCPRKWSSSVIRRRPD